MPVDLHIIRASEFVCLDAHEHLDFEATKEALATLARACRSRGLERALVDLRSFPIPEKPAFTPDELASLIDTFRDAGFTKKQRLAILYRSDPHHGARMFAFIGRIRGWHVQAFEEFEKALLWLSAQELTPNKEREEEIPIHHVKSKAKRLRAS